jgi:AcrR family transcriptional regulator
MNERISTSPDKPLKKNTEPRRKPVQGRSRVTVERVLAAAAEVIEEGGIAAGTTDRIAEGAGVSVGTLYQYFPSKEAILAALLDAELAQGTRRLQAWVGSALANRPRLRDALSDLVIDVLAQRAVRPGLRSLLLEEAVRNPTLRERVQAAEAEAGRTLAGWLAGVPGVRRAEPERGAYFMIHTIRALAHRYEAHRDEDRLEREAFVDELVDLLEAYLIRPRPIAEPSPEAVMEPPPVVTPAPEDDRDTLPVVLL